MTQQLTDEELKEYTKQKLEKIRKDPLERKPTTAREIKKFRDKPEKK